MKKLILILTGFIATISLSTAQIVIGSDNKKDTVKVRSYDNDGKGDYKEGIEMRTDEDDKDAVIDHNSNGRKSIQSIGADTTKKYDSEEIREDEVRSRDLDDQKDEYYQGQDTTKSTQSLGADSVAVKKGDVDVDTEMDTEEEREEEVRSGDVDDNMEEYYEKKNEKKVKSIQSKEREDENLEKDEVKDAKKKAKKDR